MGPLGQPLPLAGRGGHGRAVEPTASHPARTERRIINLRVTRRWGPARIAGLLGLAASTVHRVLTRFRLAHLDRATGRVIRRYEHDHAGSLVHVDIKETRQHPRAAASTLMRRSCHPVIGYSSPHNAVDDHSRLAYPEILPNERKDAAAAFWPASPPGSPPWASRTSNVS